MTYYKIHTLKIIFIIISKFYFKDIIQKKKTKNYVENISKTLKYIEVVYCIHIYILSKKKFEKYQFS